MRTLLIILIVLSCIKFSNAQTIERFSIDSGGDSATAGGIELLYTIGEVNIQERSTPTVSVSEGFVVPDGRLQLEPKLFLQGPLLAPAAPGLMNDDLRTLGYIPLQSPYADQALVAASVLNTGGTSGTGLPQDDIVDWVWAELRTASDNTKRINGRSGLLQRDGDVVDLDGISPLVMQASPTSYYVVLAHRNHMDAMSGSPIGLTNAPVSIDFTNIGFGEWGPNAQVLLGTGDKALWGGDTNLANQIRFSGANNGTNAIKDFVLADPANGFNSVTFGSQGYLNIDINMNGIGRFSGAGNDSNILKDNVLAHPANGFNSVTYTIQATVPPVNN
ncbi:MAG: hemagglutinin protein [Bacteroidia bacterium]|nr:hemagglutinin protein [Bacteroidia bacterium]NND10014.1 hemagglutinin protein [Flavobacteriaceae bacterium]NNF86222.1 hemagglutinin protein [Winogradskyella sp.]MBT8279140.1 hemagglutinin protein [Bacteroidia bacterium]NND26678.1 hemagglutinin protein [Flavobacteriaceae bacterium]